MTGEIIKQFLVGLGFGVDEKSLATFNKSIRDASIRVTALYATVKVAAAGIFWSISKISEGFEQMGYEYRIIAPAINKALVLRNELLKAYRAAGVNVTKVIQQSIKFNMELAKTKFAFQAIYASVAAKFFPMLTKQMDIFRKQIYANMPRIQNALERFVKFIFKAFEVTQILGARVFSILSRIYDFFYTLHKATDGWSSVIMGVIAAWKILNLAFLATPLGMIITGLIALLALWDDFKTFKEGGESLIDWSSDTVKAIMGVIAVIGGMAASIYAVIVAIRTYKAVVAGVQAVMAAWAAIMKIVRIGILLVNLAMYANPIGLIIAAVVALIGLLAVLWLKWDKIKEAFKSFFTGVGGKLMEFFGGVNAETMANPTGANANAGPPIGNMSNQATTNYNVQQQTAINVGAGPNAQSTGNAVASEQTRVNFDMTRNLVGATR